MAQTHDAVTLEEVLKLARQLSSVDKLRLIERVAPEVERDLTAGRDSRKHSLLGILKDLGAAPSSEEIDTARRETWASFPRNDVNSRRNWGSR
jgi:hypothetical protein